MSKPLYQSLNIFRLSGSDETIKLRAIRIGASIRPGRAGRYDVAATAFIHVGIGDGLDDYYIVSE